MNRWQRLSENSGLCTVLSKRTFLLLSFLICEMGIFKSTVSLEDYMIEDCEECTMAICTCSYCLNLWYYNYLCESPLPPSSLGNKIFILDVFIYGFQCISNMFRKQSEVLSFKSISRVFLFTPGLADKELAPSLSLYPTTSTHKG